MLKINKLIFSLSVLILIFSFIIFLFPNNTGAKDFQMLSVFEPDEYAQYPVVQMMITPKETARKTIIGFLAYDYYFYGFPFFGSSALTLLPLRWFGRAENTQLSLLSLRQIISVLPMLIALLLLVKMWDNFKTWRSPVGLVLLLTIPAITQNALWWHPDGIVLLLVVLTLYFLKKDEFHLRSFFYLSAIICGILTATKLVGLYFFLAVAYCLWMARSQNKIVWPKIIRSGLLFIALMAVSFVISNPFLLSSWGRIAWFQIFQKQSFLLNQGYGIVYPKGLLATYPLLKDSYGNAIFLLIALATNIWGAMKSQNKHLYRLILSWSLPMTITTFFLTHFKYQYWLPVGVLLISGFVGMFPEKISLKNYKSKAISIFLLFIVLGQIAFFIPQNIKTIKASYRREEDSAEISFYKHISETLKPIENKELNVYFDYRLYLPENKNWLVHTSFDLLSYDFVEEKEFDVLLLLRQRINDYLNPNAIGINQQAFIESQRFYKAAKSGKINGYILLYQDELGLIFVSDFIHRTHFVE